MRNKTILLLSGNRKHLFNFIHNRGFDFGIDLTRTAVIPGDFIKPNDNDCYFGIKLGGNTFFIVNKLMRFSTKFPEITFDLFENKTIDSIQFKNGSILNV